VTSAQPQEMEAVRRALAGHYTLDRELGHGGMATVYLARDLKHGGRPVALKVLAADLGHALGLERFRREIDTAARLQHPHVLSVFDSGDAEGRLWFTMPFVEGESLRDRLTRERQLPINDAVRIAREAAQGLHYAHRHDVVHRDIKPENILLTEDGTTLVADFGIARALGAGASGGAQDASNERLTGTGLSIGTPIYMSPEQSAGEQQIDARSDVYSLGTVLYEMLAGEPPFTGPTQQAVIAKRLTMTAPSARIVRPGIPIALDVAIARSLATSPADRYATAADFAQALDAAIVPSGTNPTTPVRAVRSKRPAGLALLAIGLLIGSGALFAWSRSRSSSRDDDALSDASASGVAMRRMAVLPFENLGRPEDAYVADGLTDEIRGRLSAIPGLVVIARASSNQYRATTKTPQTVAEELGVTYLLTGTVRSEPAAEGHPARVRVAPELIELTGGGKAPASRWSRSLDASMADVFTMQSDIASQVAGAMDVALGGGAKAQLAAVPTKNPAAHDAYLRGMALQASDAPTLRRALGHFTQAVALDSTFADAWGRRAMAASLLYNNGVPEPALAQEAKIAADRAMALAPDRSVAHRAASAYHRLVTHQPAVALADMETARRLDPGDATLLASLATTERELGRLTEAVRDGEAAAALDPRSVAAARSVAQSQLWARRGVEARAASARSLVLGPTDLSVRQAAVMAELSLGDLEAARRVLAAAPPEVDPAALYAYMGNGWDLYWVLDDASQRRLLSLRPDAFDDDRATWAYVLAQTYRLRGDAARARAYADTAQAAFAPQIRDAPDEPQRRVLRGVALALAGRAAEGIAEAERGAALSAIHDDAVSGPYTQLQLARTYLFAGQLEKALDVLEPLMRTPFYITPAWLRIDPNFTPLVGNPRFERLVAAR
jgi:eukaryotic-like serine/threonine-protein kinase